MPRRSKYDIIADIILRLHEPDGKTRIMFEANLSYDQAHQFVSQLEQHGIIQTTKDRKLVLTQKGRTVL